MLNDRSYSAKVENSGLLLHWLWVGTINMFRYCFGNCVDFNFACLHKISFTDEYRYSRNNNEDVSLLLKDYVYDYCKSLIELHGLLSISKFDIGTYLRGAYSRGRGLIEKVCTLHGGLFKMAYFLQAITTLG